MHNRSERCYELAFATVLYPPLATADLVVTEEWSTEHAVLVAGFIGLLMAPITIPIASVIVLFGKVVSLFERDDSDS